MIGHPGLAADPALRDEAGRRRRVDEIDKLIADWTTRHSADAVVALAREHRIGAAAVRPSSSILSDEHLAARGFWEVVDHDVVGTFKTTGLPFTMAGRERHWIMTPAPVYGQHTAEVLTGLLGKSADEIAAMEEVGATSRRPAGL
jgi:crotonobetainyl-CoA:carnitine CoA-transferase CaiB-like acyl-CoA transferase